MESIKQKVYDIIGDNKKDSKLGNAFAITIIALIFINVVLVIIATFKISKVMKITIAYIEVISVIIFTVEYILRLWTSTLIYPDKTPIAARIKYIFTFMAMIDLFSILPFYLPFFISIDLRVLRALRIMRLLRIFKINRYTNALSLLSKVFKKKASQLISSIFVLVLLMIISSVIIYNMEHIAQPDKFQNAFSGLWWAISTITTVGYGDIYPITALGKVLSAVIAILGIGLVAVPSGIISAGFIEEIGEKNGDSEQKEEKHYCPYCGKNID